MKHLFGGFALTLAQFGTMAAAGPSDPTEGPIVAPKLRPPYAAAIYPREALLAGEQGTAGYELELNKRGRVRSCRITASSGSARLDAATCKTMQAMNFEPARGADGQTLAAKFASKMRWTLPVAPNPSASSAATH